MNPTLTPKPSTDEPRACYHRPDAFEEWTVHAADLTAAIRALRLASRVFTSIDAGDLAIRTNKLMFRAEDILLDLGRRADAARRRRP